MILVILVLAALGFFGYKWYKGNQMVVTDDLFQQRGITINYKDGTITINNHLILFRQ